MTVQSGQRIEWSRHDPARRALDGHGKCLASAILDLDLPVERPRRK
jgi:hypothetical protein